MLKIKDFFSRRPHFVPAVIAAVMLLAALASWPYGYYKLLRWFVCAAGIFVAFTAYACEKPWALWAFVLIAMLFNPIAPVHLTRQIWSVLIVHAALGFLASIFVIWTKPSSTQTEKDQEHEALHP